MTLMKRKATKIPQALGNHSGNSMPDSGSNLIIPETGHRVMAWKYFRFLFTFY